MNDRPTPPQAVDVRTINALAWLASEMHQRWIVWRYTWNAQRQKWDKPPLTIRARNASSADSTTWVDFPTAWHAVQRRAFDGPGLMLQGLGGEFLAAIDLDDVRDPETGALLAWAQDLVDRCRSYVEITPSGAGIRILGTAERIASIQTRIQHPQGGSFELFVNCNRYITVSGQQIGDWDMLADIADVIEELAALRPAQPAGTNGAARGPISVQSLPYALQDIVTRGAQGDRSAEFFRVVRYFKACHHPVADIVALLGAYPAGIAAKYVGRLEAEVRRCWGKLDDPPEPERQPPQPETRGGRILSGEAFVNRHTPPDWLIDGLIQKGRLYACTSLTGHGKTAVWGLAACMIHAGRKFGPLEVTRGCVIYLAGENPTDLEARLIGILNAYQIEPSQLPFVLPATFPMTDDECDALKKEIEGLGVDVAMIVGDTAASFFPGDDENDNVQAGAYARRLRTLTQLPGNPAIVVLSHPVKNAAADNLLPRGGGAFLNELDGNLALWSAEVGEITQLRDGGKLRGPPFNPLDFRLRHVETGLRDAKDRPEITVVAVPISEDEAANQAKQTVWEENVVLKALHGSPGIAMADIAVAAGWVTATGLPEKWRVQRLIRSLATQKLISQPRKGMPWEINDLGRKAAGISE